MKKKRFAVLAVMLLTIVSCMLMTGCGSWKNYIHTESSLRRTAETAMKDKYEEEFVIHNVWTATQTTFYATCSPKSDEEVVFEAQIYKDGRGVFEDEYLQGAVSKQIRNRLYPKIQEIFEDSHFQVSFTLVGPKMDYYEGVTIEEYYELYDDVSIYLRIFIDKEKLECDDEIIDKEFEVLSKLLDDEIIEEAGCRCFFLDKNKVKEIKEFFSKDCEGRGDFNSITSEAIQFGFGFDNGIINESIEEYKEVRMRVNINE